jgi:hypothetical protein
MVLSGIPVVTVCLTVKDILQIGLGGMCEDLPVQQRDSFTVAAA